VCSAAFKNQQTLHKHIFMPSITFAMERVFFLRVRNSLTKSVNACSDSAEDSLVFVVNYVLLFVCLFVLVGPISTAAMKAYCTLTPMEFRHSSPEALHTKRRERLLLAKDGTKTKEFS
jgi:hypothetical protein